MAGNNPEEQPTQDVEVPTNEPEPALPPSIPSNLAYRLYISHFLSTWNSRLFEFGSVLFLASIYPQTLLPMSVYALVRSGAAIVFSQALGFWIDRGERLATVQTSIVGQRLAVAGSCVIFGLLQQENDIIRGGKVKDGLFAVTVVLACVEKLCSVLNTVSIERDWIVVITEGNEGVRRVMNARMRRIDLFCKLVGPLTISLVASASTLIAIRVTFAMSVASVLVEVLCIAQVYKAFPQLRRNEVDEETINTTMQQTSTPATLVRCLNIGLRNILPISSLRFYFTHPAFVPSFALSLLYFTVLSFSGQMITYLVSVGYSTLYIGIARTVSTALELSATWIAPRMMKRVGVVRGGIWSLCWQMAWLGVGVTWFFANSNREGRDVIIAATGLAVGVALSRIGLWGYDLCAQNLIQDVSQYIHIQRKGIDRKDRKSKIRIAENSPPPKPLFKTYSNYCLMRQRSSFQSRRSSSGRSLSVR
ncbi:iron-regulated transporter, putative [Talaromyces stipitatus ATCC 10500]|uniref:Solute carrier family 40 member n=1 Tax=Talaromyces stipitatus (strain ATCC 10500 / CBS 375.48 / QM 6759 / NRRL 1006) TaxID=441959 RepID=B8M970_TALSN|nr:iron-regulated transporter, putative [Talaromyces stipitatus ATCC 10500]EED17365.1 iron-regulated transporter, putative [Talaromyces stipitatus ATCC 10500]